jgi:hypothetical protein
MESVTPRIEKVTKAADGRGSPDAEPSGLRPARSGLQPVGDLGTFFGHFLILGKAPSDCWKP